MVPSTNYYGFDNNSSPFSFWNSPDYFKFYDEIGVLNQTTILNQTKSSTSSLLASVSASTSAYINDAYDDNFSLDTDDIESIYRVRTDILRNINGKEGEKENQFELNNYKNKITKNSKTSRIHPKNLNKFSDVSTRSSSKITNDNFKDIFKDKSQFGQQKSLKFSTSSEALIDVHNLLNQNEQKQILRSKEKADDSSSFDYASGEFGIIDGSNGYKYSQTGGFERFFNSNNNLTIKEDFNGKKYTNIDNGNALKSLSNFARNDAVSLKTGAISSSENYKNYDTGNNEEINSREVDIVGNKNLDNNDFNALSNINTFGNSGGSNFMLLFEDFGEYFYNYNSSKSSNIDNNNNDFLLNGNAFRISTPATSNSDYNITDFDLETNCSAANASCEFANTIAVEYNFWALILILFPILTLFGNILVILSVVRERSLQSVTNYFIVSLALADLLVAVFVMPFGVYVLVNGAWSLPNFVCDFYIAMDVICSTSSIFNLVAISIDRYIAVTQPIKYAKHKNSRRVCLTILLVWAISAAIGSPIVLGLNNTPNREPDLCIFYNTDFILYSSLSSFYIPCIIMVFLYWNIFKALRHRALKHRAARKPNLSDMTTGGSVIENIAQTRRLAETTLDNSIRGIGIVCTSGARVMPDDNPTNTASGSNEEEDENVLSPEDIDDCHVIVNDKSTEFMLATVVEETGNVVAQITTTPNLVVADSIGNHDSGYAPSNVDDVVTGNITQTPPESPITSGILKKNKNESCTNSGLEANGSSPKREVIGVPLKPLSLVRYGVQGALALTRHNSTMSTSSKASRKDKKNSQTSRFTLYKVHKASKKKREKSSAKKERKATKTLAIVLGVFLICWLPFFSCNIMDALCTKLNKSCSPGVTIFILTTWLGYMNSFVNPIIYTIFNPEFRKAFKKIMHMG